MSLAASAPPAAPAARLARAGVPLASASGRIARVALRNAGMPERIEIELLGAAPRAASESVFLGVDLGPLIGDAERNSLERWAREAAGYIRSVGEETRQAIAGDMAEAVAEGRSWRSLRETIEQRTGHGRARVELIARDQTAKLNSRITEDLQRQAGVEEYTWRANNDGRTRSVHLQANGTRVRWDSPGYPGAGFYGRPAHAGRGGQCRCTPEPIAPASWGL